MNKVSKQERKEYNQRVYNTVEEMVGKGYSYSQKFRELAAIFNVTERQGREYIKFYNEERKRLNNEQTFNSREDAIAQYDYLYKQAMKEGNKREARECLDAKIKLMGLAAPKQVVNVNANLNTTEDRIDYSKFSPEQLKTILSLQQSLQQALLLNTNFIKIEHE